MQLDPQALLTEACEMALTIRLLEKQNAALVAENERLKAEVAPVTFDSDDLAGARRGQDSREVSQTRS